MLEMSNLVFTLILVFAIESAIHCLMARSVFAYEHNYYMLISATLNSINSEFPAVISLHLICFQKSCGACRVAPFPQPDNAEQTEFLKHLTTLHGNPMVIGTFCECCTPFKAKITRAPDRQTYVYCVENLAKCKGRSSIRQTN